MTLLRALALITVLRLGAWRSACTWAIVQAFAERGM